LNFFNNTLIFCSSYNTGAAVKGKGKKRPRETKSEVDEFVLNETTREWYRSHKLVTGPHWQAHIAKHSIPTSYMGHPDQKMAARENMLGHSKEIKDKMLTGGVAEGNVTCVIFKQDVEAIGGIDNLWAIASDDSSKPPIHFHTITGDHTGAGAQMALAEQPQRKDLRRLMVSILLCDKEDPTDWMQAHQYGVYDNKLADAHRSHNVWDIVNIMHNFILHTKQDHPDDMFGKPHAEFNRKLKQKRQAMEVQYDTLAKNTQGSLWVIAQRTGKLWDLIKKINIGDRETEGSAQRYAQGPMSHGHFTNMSDIPDDILIGWLTTVYNTPGTKTKWFNDQCMYYKKVIWVKGHILEFVHQLQPSLREELKTYDDVATRFPPFNEGTVFNEWVFTCGKVAKAGLPATVRTSITAKLNMCLQREVIHHIQTHTHTDAYAHHPLSTFVCVYSPKIQIKKTKNHFLFFLHLNFLEKYVHSYTSMIFKCNKYVYTKIIIPTHDIHPHTCDLIGGYCCRTYI
jgi:hypothetical protein